jgi:hypothetical protein
MQGYRVGASSPWRERSQQPCGGADVQQLDTVGEGCASGGRELCVIEGIVWDESFGRLAALGAADTVSPRTARARSWSACIVARAATANPPHRPWGAVESRGDAASAAIPACPVASAADSNAVIVLDVVAAAAAAAAASMPCPCRASRVGRATVAAVVIADQHPEVAAGAGAAVSLVVAN